MRALLLAALVVAAPSHAQDAQPVEVAAPDPGPAQPPAEGPSAPAPGPAQPPAVSAEAIAQQREEPRVRFGLGGGGGWAPGGLGVGLGVDVGLQVTDHFALYVRGTVDTLILSVTSYAALLGEVGFDRVTIATGVGVMVAGTICISSCLNQGIFVGIPVVVGITPFGRDDTSVGRKGFHIWLDGAVGVRPGFNGLTGYGGVKLGYVWR